MLDKTREGYEEELNSDILPTFCTHARMEDILNFDAHTLEHHGKSLKLSLQYSALVICYMRYHVLCLATPYPNND